MPAHAIGRTPRNPLHPSKQRGEARSGRETTNRRGLDHVSLRSSAWRIVQEIGHRGPITAEKKITVLDVSSAFAPLTFHIREAL